MTLAAGHLALEHSAPRDPASDKKPRHQIIALAGRPGFAPPASGDMTDHRQRSNTGRAGRSIRPKMTDHRREHDAARGGARHSPKLIGTRLEGRMTGVTDFRPRNDCGKAGGAAVQVVQEFVQV